MELLPEWAPNVHPMIVHFPIALIVAAIGADLLSLLLSRRDWLRPASVGLYVVGGASALLTYLTGTWAADTVSVSGEAQSVLTAHADLGWWTMWFFGIYGIARLAAHLWPKTRGRRAVQGPLLVLAIAGAYLLYETADHGAEMVYGYGVGVQRPQPERGFVEPGLTVGESGWQWQPRSDTAWTERMRWWEGTPDAVRARLDTLEDGSIALAIAPSVPVTFVVPDTLGPVELTAELNRDEFQGTVSLLHHVQDDRNYDYLSTDGQTVRQGRISGGERAVLDQAAIETTGWTTFRVVGDGTHFRGYLDGELVTHPHGEALGPGAAGLRLEGTGTVRLRVLRAEALR